jgi:hypothetical protein
VAKLPPGGLGSLGLQKGVSIGVLGLLSLYLDEDNRHTVQKSLSEVICQTFKGLAAN